MGLFILVGIPASGKSTFCKSVLLRMLDNVLYISTDKIREELGGSEDSQVPNKLVLKILYERIEEGLKQGKNVIVDATNIKKSWRQPLISMGQKYKVPIYAYVLSKSLDECIENNNKRSRKVPIWVIEKYYRDFEIPDISEGFTAIFIINDFKVE